MIDMTVTEALSMAYDRCRVLLPGMCKGDNATMVEVALMGEDYGEHRPVYAYRLSEVTEGGPRTIFEGDDLRGPAMGCWPEPEEMVFTVLGFLCVDPEDVGDGYGSEWTEAQREWNHANGEQLETIAYDLEAFQIGNAGPDPLDTDEALAAVTEVWGLTWLHTGYDFDGILRDFRDKIDRARVEMGMA